jgi:CheY-like chemotaxis protein
MKEILIAVAQSDLRKIVSRILTQEGARVQEEEFGSKVFQHIESSGVDLIILDLHLTDLNGDEVLEEIRRSYPRLPVLMLIQDPDPWFIERCKKAGAQAVLSYAEVLKDSFLSTVRKLLSIEPRLSLRVPVQYYLVESKTKEVFVGESVDVSLSGILLLSERCLVEPGMLVDIRLGIQPPLLARGEIVRITEGSGGYRIAVAFKQFRTGDRQRLRSLIYGSSAERKKGDDRPEKQGSTGTRGGYS